MKCIRTQAANKDFQQLVARLDADLSIRDGEEHAFYDQFNQIDAIHHVLVAYEDGWPAGCGALKEFTSEIVEIKRMYVCEAFRRKGIASRILSELETWAKELKYKKCILETGKKQPEAIGLYKKAGYILIPNYAQYRGMENSICFEKKLKS